MDYWTIPSLQELAGIPSGGPTGHWQSGRLPPGVGTKNVHHGTAAGRRGPLRRSDDKIGTRPTDPQRSIEDAWTLRHHSGGGLSRGNSPQLDNLCMSQPVAV